MNMRRFPATASLTAMALAFASPAMAQARPTTYPGTLQACPNGQEIRLEAGRRYTIGATSTAFDPVLRVHRRGSDAVLAQDDDGGEGNNSQLTFAPTETGAYLACVSSFGASGTGAFTITVEQGGPLPPTITEPTGTETATWQVYEGTLADGDQRDGGGWFDDYEIVMERGERALISLESAAFDTLLKVYRLDRGGEPLATDDDGGGGLNSFLVFPAADGGRYVVRVTAFSGSGGGAYRLRVSRGTIPWSSPPQEDGEAEHPEH